MASLLNNPMVEGMLNSPEMMQHMQSMVRSAQTRAAQRVARAAPGEQSEAYTARAAWRARRGARGCWSRGCTDGKGELRVHRWERRAATDG